MKLQRILENIANNRISETSEYPDAALKIMAIVKKLSARYLPKSVSGVDLLKIEPKFIAALKAAGLDSISNETLSALEDANYSTALDIILDNHLNSEPF